MPSRHLSIRIEQDSFERLEAESRRRHEPTSTLAKRLIEEGLRMQKHPGIVFRDGATGRRAKLVDGEDVWLAISAFPMWDERWDTRNPELVGGSALTAAQIWIAQKYYADYPDEVDERIQANDAAERRAIRIGLRRQPVHSV